MLLIKKKTKKKASLETLHFYFSTHPHSKDSHLQSDNQAKSQR